MIAGAPHEARWTRPEPRRALPAALLAHLVRVAFPHSQVVEALPLTDGFRNANFKIRLDSPAESVVLRIYEHDSSLCQKEMDLIRLVARYVPVPEVIHAGLADTPPFALLRYVDGVSFHEIKKHGDAASVAQAAYAVGQTLASIHRITFEKPGWLAPGPSVTAPLLAGRDAMPRYIDLCLASINLCQRVQEELRERIHTFVWSFASELRDVESEAYLVHGDFGNRNLLLRNQAGRWEVAAVLDWEFSVSSCPLADLGHFLRYERYSRPLVEPHFSHGYQDAGGALPKHWRHLARVLDLTALCESLTHDQLPGAVVSELVELVRATVEGRDPQFS
jgi:aminoglycoside phosphotransferase (APT) family kinase protein